MKILLSVFAFSPSAGSEAGGGWHFATRLAREHEVWALTDSSRQAAVESCGGVLPANLHIVYYRPRLLRRMRLHSKTAHLIYQGWQMGAWRLARRLDKQHGFDLVWHLTYGVFRQPSWMWKLGKPFVFGPVGGGERAPIRLWRGMPFGEQCREAARDVFNAVSWRLPGLRATYRHADLVIARTEDTRAILPAWVQEKAAVQQEIGGYAAKLLPAQRAGHQGRLNILFAGRLLGWKGVHLAIRAVAEYLANGGAGQFTIVGEGPMAAHLNALSVRLGVADHIRFVGKVSQEKLFRLYPQFDVLLFPSLHDSGGNVVIEALSFGLPVVCLDLGGPRSFANESCGVVVAARDRSEDQVVTALAEALNGIYSDPDRHRSLCHGALKRAEELTGASKNLSTSVIGKIALS